MGAILVVRTRAEIEAEVRERAAKLCATNAGNKFSEQSIQNVTDVLWSVERRGNCIYCFTVRVDQHPKPEDVEHEQSVIRQLKGLLT